MLYPIYGCFIFCEMVCLHITSFEAHPHITRNTIYILTGFCHIRSNSEKKPTQTSSWNIMNKPQQDTRGMKIRCHSFLCFDELFLCAERRGWLKNEIIFSSSSGTLTNMIWYCLWHATHTWWSFATHCSRGQLTWEKPSHSVPHNGLQLRYTCIPYIYVYIYSGKTVGIGIRDCIFVYWLT